MSGKLQPAPRSLGGLIHSHDGSPIIAFDEVPFFGTLDGIGRITLAAQVLSSETSQGAVPADHIITAHLRGSLRAWVSLRDTIDRMLLAAIPADPVKN